MTSYKISNLLARKLESYPNGEIMKQAIAIFTKGWCSTCIQLNLA